MRLTASFAFLAVAALWGGQSRDAGSEPAKLLIENVRVFDGTSDRLSPSSNVLVIGDRIQEISRDRIVRPSDATVVDGGGRVLTPGFIDAHVHLSLVLPTSQLFTTDTGYVSALTARAAERALMRGFTTVRDTGGPVFGLKRAIDEGILVGPRIYPSGAAISQTSGHGDYRSAAALHPFWGGQPHLSEMRGFFLVADGIPQVLAAVREQLRLGATQIKLMAGGGVLSVYDPLDVSQFTFEELKAAVDAAADWGTYVSVHVYNSTGIRRAITAGVKVIEHGHLMDESTMTLMAEKGTFLSTQVVVFTEPIPGLNEEQTRRWKEVQDGTDTLMKLAKKHGVATGFGTDLVGSLAVQERESREFTLRQKWFSPADVLRQATSVNARVLALSGKRNPYPGTLGVINAGAIADLLLIDGNPLDNLALLENPDKNLVLIVKGGKIFKNVLH